MQLKRHWLLAGLIVAVSTPAMATVSVVDTSGYTLFTGSQVSYRVDLANPAFAGMSASVVGNQLVFAPAAGNSYLRTSLLRGNGAGSSLLSNSLPSVVVEANQGFKLASLTGTLTATTNTGVTLKSGGTLGYNTTFDFQASGGTLGSSGLFAQGASAGSYAGQLGASVSNAGNSNWVLNNSVPLSYHTSGTALSLNGGAALVNSFGIATAVQVAGAAGRGIAQNYLTSFGFTAAVSPVPEPETWAMLGLGLTAVLLRRRRAA